MKKLATTTLGMLTLSAAVSTPTQFILKHREHNGIGYDTGYTTAEAFLASKWKNGFMPYADFRGHVFDDGRFATNAGLGLRYNWSGYTFGGNFYYDYRDAKNLQPHQLAGGLEFLTNNYDIRLNGYGPIADTTVEKQARFVKFQGNGAIFKRRFKAALPMIEGEYGMPFGSRCGIANFYGAIGPYYLFEKKVSGTRLGDAVGGQARILLNMIQRFGFQFNFSYDKIYKWIFQGTGGISIPLGKTERIWKSKNFLCEARNQLPVRKEIIPIECKSKRAESSSRIIFVDNTSSSDGTFESPYPTTALAMANSRAGDIIYIFPGDGTTTGYNTPITLLSDQTLQSSSVKLNLGNGLVVPAQTYAFPKLTSAGNTITLTQSNVVKGLNISSTGGLGITESATIGGANRVEANFIHNCLNGIDVGSATTSTNYVIVKNTIRQCSQDGILLNLVGTLTNQVNAVIAENTASNITATGISVEAVGGAQAGLAVFNNQVGTSDNGFAFNAADLAVSTVYAKYNETTNASTNGMLLTATNTSTANYTLSGNTAVGGTNAVQLNAALSGNLSVNLIRNRLQNAGSNSDGILNLASSGSTTLSVNLTRNVITGTGVGTLIDTITATNFSLSATDNLYVNTTNGGVFNTGLITVTGDYSYDLISNRFVNITTRPIRLASQSATLMQASLLNNVLTGTIQDATLLVADGGNICATIIGNIAKGQNLELDQTNPATLQVESLTPGSAEGLLELNDFSAVSPTGTVNYVPFGTCP